MMENTGRLLVAMAVCLACLLAGCFHAESQMEWTGTRVPPDVLRQIDCGTSTKSELVALLGQPTHSSRLDDGRELLKYESTLDVRESASSLLGSARKQRKTRHMHVFEATLP